MSTQSESISSTSPPSPSPTQTTGGFGSGNNTGNLYLITFLATLFLLLFISCAIVLRSYVLRRRFQRQLDEAMAAGILLTPRTPGSRKRRFGTKPKFHDIWLVRGGDTWNQMMPVSALPIQVKRRYKGAALGSKPSNTEMNGQVQSPSPPPSPLPEIPRPHPRRLFRSIGWHDEIEDGPGIEPEKPSRPRVDMLQVSILVAMPSAKRPSSPLISEKGDEESEVPGVVFGVTRLPYKSPL